MVFLNAFNRIWKSLLAEAAKTQILYPMENNFSRHLQNGAELKRKKLFLNASWSTFHLAIIMWYYTECVGEYHVEGHKNEEILVLL